MGRIAGVPNKLTSQMKQKLQGLIDGIITDIKVEDLNTNQKLKLLQISLQYILPRLKYTSNEEAWEDKPLFIETEVIKRDEEGNWESRILTNEVNTETD